MPLFDVAAAEAAELARVGWCGWRFGRCGWFCMDRVLVTWTFEAEHRRDGSGRSAGRPPITKSVGCGNISPRRLTKAMTVFVGRGVQSQRGAGADALVGSADARARGVAAKRP